MKIYFRLSKVVLKDQLSTCRDRNLVSEIRRDHDVFKIKNSELYGSLQRFEKDQVII